LSATQRLRDLIRFYAILDGLSQRVGGARALIDSNGRHNWPERGIYFFFEPGEMRSDSGIGLRVVRVGTHALRDGAGTSLWGRLCQHRGVASSGSGNHRGSIFRLLVGAALQRTPAAAPVPSWGCKQDLATAARFLGTPIEQLRADERLLEVVVSRHIGAMPFLWIDVPDIPAGAHQRGAIERGAIALLSNWRKSPLDPSSPGWLGHRSDRERVRESGLWNNHHVDEAYDASFLDPFEKYAAATRALAGC
jgi:hypothetical protein